MRLRPLMWFVMSRQFGLVELHESGRLDLFRERTVLHRLRADAGLRDAVGRELKAADDARRQGFGLADAPLPLDQRHTADGALVRVVADDGRVHRAPELAVGVGGLLRGGEGARPFLIQGVDPVPVENDAADGGQQHEKRRRAWIVFKTCQIFQPRLCFSGAGAGPSRWGFPVWKARWREPILGHDPVSRGQEGPAQARQRLHRRRSNDRGSAQGGSPRATPRRRREMA